MWRSKANPGVGPSLPLWVSVCCPLHSDTSFQTWPLPSISLQKHWNYRCTRDIWLYLGSRDSNSSPRLWKHLTHVSHVSTFECFCLSSFKAFNYVKHWAYQQFRGYMAMRAGTGSVDAGIWKGIGHKKITEKTKFKHQQLTLGHCSLLQRNTSFRWSVARNLSQKWAATKEKVS